MNLDNLPLDLIRLIIRHHSGRNPARDSFDLSLVCRSLHAQLPAPPLHVVVPSPRCKSLAWVLQRLKAHASVASANLPEIWLKAGKYRLRRQITLDFPIKIVGRGCRQTRLLGGIQIGEGTFQHDEFRSRFAIQLEESEESKVTEARNIRDEEAAGRVWLQSLTVTSQDGEGIFASGNAALPLHLENVEVTLCKESAVSILNGGVLTARNCEFHRNGAGGICLWGNGTSGRLMNVTCHHNIWSGLDCYDGAHVTLFGAKSAYHDNGHPGLVSRGSGSRVLLSDGILTSDDDRREDDGGRVMRTTAEE